MIWGTSETPVGRLIAKWHRQHHEGSAFVPPYSAVAWRDSGGDFRASAIFCNYTGSNIDIHLVVKSKPSIRILRDIMRYVFVQLKCRRLTAIVPESHTKLLRLVRGLGGEISGSLRNWTGRAETGLIFSFYPEDAEKILNGRFTPTSPD